MYISTRTSYCRFSQGPFNSTAILPHPKTGETKQRKSEVIIPPPYYGGP